MNKYSYQSYDEETMVGSISRNLSISTKQSIEICSYIKGKTADRAITILEEAAALKKAIPFTRFTDGAGHKSGPMASGKFAVKASEAILGLLKTAVANADIKGLNTPLIIVHAVANNAGNKPRYGRQRGRSSKSTHVEIVLAETSGSVETKGKKKSLVDKNEKKKVVKKKVVKKKVVDKEVVEEKPVVADKIIEESKSKVEGSKVEESEVEKSEVEAVKENNNKLTNNLESKPKETPKTEENRKSDSVKQE